VPTQVLDPFAKSGKGRRDELGVLLDILRLGNSPVKKTHVLYRANLGFSQMERYLNFLLARGLLEECGGEVRMYRTTSRGKALIELLETNEDKVPRSSPTIERIEKPDVAKRKTR